MTRCEPLSGGRHGRPFGRPLVDLDAAGYVEEEWLLAGDAVRYRPKPGTELGADGVWEAEEAESAPYATRVVVYRPADPARFNGTVVQSWNNVTAGYDLFGGESPELLEGGYAYVGVTVQKVGQVGLPPANQGLLDWDPERYAGLTHPGDDYSFDIFTQAARAVRSGELLGDLEVQRIIAMGGSQSAGRLGAYVNAVHPLTHAFDGYLLTIYFGSGTQLEVGDMVVNINAPAVSASPRAVLRGRNLLRSIDVPVFVVNSELEAIACLAVRQPDTDRFRYWESAGTCHVSQQGMAVRGPKYQRDFGVELPVTPGMNNISMQPLYDSALHHLNRWITDGTTPPSQPLVDFDGEGEVVRDEHGIATGGIRLPAADVPIEQNSAIPLSDGIFALLYGSSKPFPAEQVQALYGDVDTYVARFEDAARAAEKAGVLLPRDVESLVAEARSAYPA
jgi:hypothetical protein